MSKQEVNLNTLAQAMHIYHDRMHPGLARVKTRSEVNRTTKKLYKQKHTGGARHGSKKAPIFVGGGVTHGPKGVKRQLVLPTALRAHAKALALEVMKAEKLVTTADFTGVTKTKDAVKLLPTAKKHTVILTDGNKGAFRALRNVANLTVYYAKDVNARHILVGGHIVVEEATKKASVKENTAKKVTKKTTK